MSNLHGGLPDLSIIGSQTSFIIPIFTIKLYSMEDYRLDRSHFIMLTLQEADEQWNDLSPLDWKQRLRLVMYLNSMAYGYAGQEAPVMDRTAFQAGKLTDF